MTLRIGQKVTVQQGELEVTGELTCARVYLKGGDPNGYVLGQARPTPEPKKRTLEELMRERADELAHRFKEGDWVLVKDEELTWKNKYGDTEEGNQAYRGVKAQVVCVYEDGNVELQHPYMDYPMTVSPHHLTKEDN